MNRFVVTVILLFVASNCLFGQNNPDTKTNIRAGVFGWGMGDVPETWDNMKTEKISSFIPAQDILAVRLCSIDPLSIALETAFISPITRIQDLESQGVSERDEKTGEAEELAVLRSQKSCGISAPKQELSNLKK